MAKKKPVKKAANKKTQKKKRSSSLSTNVFLVVLLLMSVVFLPTAIIFFIGLLPTFVAFFVDRNKRKIKPVTVGAMNLAGCMPFVMELWTTGHSMSGAVSIIFDPMAIIVIYAAAGVGYLLDWVVTIAVARFLYQRGLSRQKAIEKRQGELIKRWGEEVSGRLVLDHEGFPVDEDASVNT